MSSVRGRKIVWVRAHTDIGEPPTVDTMRMLVSCVFLPHVNTEVLLYSLPSTSFRKYFVLHGALTRRSKFATLVMFECKTICLTTYAPNILFYSVLFLNISVPIVKTNTNYAKNLKDM